VRLATDVRPTGEEPRQGASPAALGALMNRVNNLLRGQAGSALSVSHVVFITCRLSGSVHLLLSSAFASIIGHFDSVMFSVGRVQNTLPRYEFLVSCIYPCQRLARRLSSEPTMLDTAARDEVQHAAFHAGHLMQQIGALLLELGRATLSLRMGQSPVRFPDFTPHFFTLAEFSSLAPI